METPGRRSRARKSNTPEIKQADTRQINIKSHRIEDHVEILVPGHHEAANGSTKANGIANEAKRNTQLLNEWEEGKDPRVDYSGHFEFGGSLGVGTMMIGFPVLMYYMW